MRVFTELPPTDWRSVGPVARSAELAGFDALMTVELGNDVLAARLPCRCPGAERVSMLAGMKRFGGSADSIAIPLTPGWEPGAVKEMLAEIHRIPHAFRGFKNEG